MILRGRSLKSAAAVHRRRFGWNSNDATARLPDIDRAVSAALAEHNNAAAEVKSPVSAGRSNSRSSSFPDPPPA